MMDTTKFITHDEAILNVQQGVEEHHVRRFLIDYITQQQSMAVENQQLKDEVNLLRGNKAKLAKISYAQGYNAAIKDIEKGSVISPIGVDE